MRKEEEDVTLNHLCVAVHSSLAVLHLLGVLYNLNRKKYLNSLIHASVFSYDVLSTIRHIADYDESRRKK